MPDVFCHLTQIEAALNRRFAGSTLRTEWRLILLKAVKRASRSNRIQYEHRRCISRLFRKHNGDLEDEPDNLLDGLRPYSGIKQSHFSEIVHALLVVAPLLNSKDEVDRKLVHTIWDLTRSARLRTIGPREPMFHGKNFISESDKRTLDRWIDQIEDLTLRLLNGLPAWYVFSDVANEINIHNGIVDPTFPLSSFCQALQYHLEQEGQGGMGDDSEMLCEALGNIGPRNDILADTPAGRRNHKACGCEEGRRNCNLKGSSVIGIGYLRVARPHS